MLSAWVLCQISCVFVLGCEIITSFIIIVALPTIIIFFFAQFIKRKVNFIGNIRMNIVKAACAAPASLRKFDPYEALEPDQSTSSGSKQYMHALNTARVWLGTSAEY